MDRRISGFKLAPIAALLFSFQTLSTEAISTEEAALEHILVTAQKQKQPIQEISQSISVLSEDMVDSRNLLSLADVSNQIPNLMLHHSGVSGMNRPTMRGLSVMVESMSVSAGLFIDDVATINPSMFELDLLDVERVEVLRGPQSTLFGKGAQAGAIRIVTRKPDDVFRANLAVQAGEDNKRQLSFGVGGALNPDSLYLSINGSSYQKDGFIENTYNPDFNDDQAHWSGNVKLRWLADKDTEVRLHSEAIKFNDGAPRMNMTSLVASMFGLPTPQYQKMAAGIKGKNKASKYNHSLHIDYAIDSHYDLTSITAYELFRDDFLADFDMHPMMLLHNERDAQYKTLSQEIRLGYADSTMQWVTGVYFDKDSADIYWADLSVVPQLQQIKDREHKGDTQAWFGHLTYSLSERLDVVVGMRLERESKQAEIRNQNVPLSKDAWSSFSPKLAVEYMLSDKVMAYVSAAKGFRSGGFNVYADTASEFAMYDQENLWSYEMGIKSDWLDDTLRLNAALYYMDISDMQVENATSPATGFLDNAAEATGKGAEIELTAVLSRQFSLSAGAAYNSTKFDRYSDFKGDYAGNTNPYSPKYTLNMAALYEHDSGWFASLDMTAYSKIYLDRTNLISKSAYQLVNTKLGYRVEAFEIAAYVRNLFDEDNDYVGYADGFWTLYGEPREAGLTFRYRFH